MRDARIDRWWSVLRAWDPFLAVLLGLGLGGAACSGPTAPLPPLKGVSFRNPAVKTYAEGRNLNFFAVGDVDGDGRPDVVSNDGNRLAIYRGNAAGGIAEEPLDGGLTLSFNIALADLNGDGRADLVGAGAESGNVRIALGRADGTFDPSIAYGVPATFVNDFSVADLTGDGSVDVLIYATTLRLNGGTQSFFAVLPNKGNGVFGDPLLTPLDINPEAYTIAELNSDGTTDVAIMDADSNDLVLLFNDGFGNLSPSRRFALEGTTANGPLLSGDFDGDGRNDLLVVAGIDSTDGLTILRNLGGAMFEPLPAIQLDTAVNIPLTADLDNDGRTDVIVVLPNGAIQVLRADGVTLKPTATYSTGGSAGLVRVADFDLDGDVDLAIGNNTLSGGNLALLRNDGRGLFDGMFVYPTPAESSAMALGDLTGDGLTDIAVSASDFQGGRSLVILASAGPTTTPLRRTVMPLAVGVGPGMAVGDLNNDRIPDVALTASGGGAVLLGSSGGHLGPPTFVDVGVAGKIAIGDVDGDAFADLAVTSADVYGDIRLFSNQGNGSFRPLHTYHAGEGEIRALEISDVTGDGRPEVVSTMPTLDGTGIINILSAGQRTFAAPFVLPVAPTLDALVVTDIDGDGRRDLVGSSASSPEVALLFGTRGGRPFSRRSIDLGALTAGAASADFNNDGWPDLAFAVQVTGEVFVLLNDNRGSYPERQVIPLYQEPQGLAAGDLNGDGKVDLAVATLAGVVVLWNTSE